MKSFDMETKSRLFSILNEDRTSTGFTKTPRPKAKTTWAYTGDMPTATGLNVLPGTGEMADPRTQIAWARYKKLVDPVIDYSFGIVNGIPTGIAGPVALKVSDKLGLSTTATKMAKSAAGPLVSTALADPVTQFAVRQMVKSELAAKYMGNTEKSEKELDDIVKNRFNVAKEYSGIATATIKQILSDIPYIGTKSKEEAAAKAGTLKTTEMDPVMKKISEKLPELAVLGIDPLDWSTNLMGADEAEANVEKMAIRGRGTKSAGGYLLTGQQKGIY